MEIPKSRNAGQVKLQRDESPSLRDENLSYEYFGVVFTVIA